MLLITELFIQMAAYRMLIARKYNKTKKNADDCTFLWYNHPHFLFGFSLGTYRRVSPDSLTYVAL